MNDKIEKVDWGDGRTRHGSGPTYVLTGPKEVLPNGALDIRTGPSEIVDPGLKDLLHGFKAFPSDGWVYQVAGRLAQIAQMRPNTTCDQKWYHDAVYVLIQTLVGGRWSSKTRTFDGSGGQWSPDAKTLEKFIKEFATIQRVAWYLLRRSYGAKDISVSWEDKHCKLWTFDQDGMALAVVDSDYALHGGAGSLLTSLYAEYKKLQRTYGAALTPQRLQENLEPISYLVRTNSPLATLTNKLGGEIPSKGELAGHLHLSAKALRNWCQSNGANWLPPSERGKSFFGSFF